MYSPLSSEQNLGAGANMSPSRDGSSRVVMSCSTLRQLASSDIYILILDHTARHVNGTYPAHIIGAYSYDHQ